VEHVEEILDPTIELNRLIREEKYEEAFNKAFSSGDLQVVSWLCLQLDPSPLLATVPLPVSQVVLLSLVRHLSFDLVNDTSHKLLWIKEAALALNLDDPRLVPHMRGYLEQTYQNCHKFMSVTKVQSEQAMLRLVIHLINSLLSSCS
jgi:enhancer of mRNA-decapping protein 4